MGAPDIRGLLTAKGLTLRPTPDGNLEVWPRRLLTDETRRLIRAHKAELLAALAEPEVFAFNPPGDLTSDDEALQERVAIMMEGNGWDDAQALQEARWQADRERCWRTFLRNAERVLQSPKADREALLARYRAEAERRYGERTALDMANSLASWMSGQGVH